MAGERRQPVMHRDKVTKPLGREGLLKKDIPMTGKMRLDIDPLLLATGDFRQLINIRYTNNGIRGMTGMTAISNHMTGFTISNGFHFRKATPRSSQPVEDHVFGQATSISPTKLVKSNYIANVPNADTFSDFLTLVDSSPVYFSTAPNGAMMAMDGYSNYIWAGNEDYCNYFAVVDPGGTFWYDYTTQVNNTLADSQNIAKLAAIGGGIDSNTASILHLDNNITDSATAPKTYTDVGSHITYDNSDYIFGSYSAIFNGTNAYLTTPDHADFDFTGGAFAIDGRFKFTSFAANNPIYYQSDGSGNYIKIYVDTSGFIHLVIHQTTDLVSLVTNRALSINTWYYISVEENANNYYIFVGATAGTASIYAQTSNANRALNYTNVVQIGYDGSNYLYGKVDEFRVSKVNRHTQSFSVPLTVYTTSSSNVTIYIGATRPLKGVTFYIGTANGNAATVAGYEWQGSSWVSLAVTDGTSSGGKTLAVNGEISFPSTVTTSKPKFVKNIFGYFYQFAFTGVDTATTIYYTTTDAPIQSVVDIWDGTPRSIASAYIYTTAYYDVTTNVYKQDYLASDATTFAACGSLTSSQYIYLGFNYRLSGMRFTLPDATAINTTANTIMSIDYWNGASWIGVGFVDDGTSSSGVSFAQGGTAFWNALPVGTEFQVNVSSSDTYNYYRVHFSQTLSSSVKLDMVEGIPAPEQIGIYRFAFNWQNRLWLFNEVSGRRDSSRCTAYGTNCSFNGSDSAKINYGDNSEITAAGSLFTRYGGTLYDNMIVFKKDSMYLVDGTTPQNWKIYTVSDTLGCIAPLTLQKCDVAYEIAPGITKHVLMWLSTRGIEFFDGNAISTVSDDIDTFFEPSSPDYINTAMTNSFCSYYDEENFEYHILFATGAHTTLNKELAYDMKRKKWFEVSRGTGKDLSSAWTVIDTQGCAYNYGGTRDGYIERLGIGNTFDGNNIVYTMFLGDLPLIDTLDYTSDLRHVKLTALAKTTASTGTITHYRDGEPTGMDLPAFSMASANRIFYTKKSVNRKASCHGIKIVVSTNDVSIGFEPLMISLLYRVGREDII